MVINLLDKLLEFANDHIGPDSLAKINGLRNARRVRAILDLASSDPRLRCRIADLDANPNLLNFTNGTLDLTTLTLREHDPRDLITKRIETAYLPDASAPRWEQFQREVAGGDEDLMRYKQKLAGYVLLGSQLEQKVFFFHGNGANGKSVELEVLKSVLGPYATTVPGEAFLRSAKGDPRHTFARLPGVRLAVASEIDERQPLAEGAIKSLTGGEELTARHLYKDEFTFHPMFTLVIATNHLPRVNRDDAALRRRLVVVPFPTTFAPDQRDPHLTGTLRSEAAGIIAWAVNGLAHYQQEGLEPPQAVSDATLAFWQAGDSVQAWLAENTDARPATHMLAQDAYAEYNEYCRTKGIEPLSTVGFGRRMGELGFNEATGKRRQNAQGRQTYVGIGRRAGVTARLKTLN